VPRRPAPLSDFLHDESAGGAVLLAATLAAVAWANLAPAGYTALWTRPLDLGIELDLRHWVNDGLMALFFFVVGLEIKRELVVGELRDRRAAALPAIAALGGVAFPAAIFFACTAGTGAARGWAIPAATDIAFAVGVLAVLGRRVPSGVRLFLLAIAIIDDVVAIAIIAVFYASDLSFPWLGAGLLGLAAVVALRRAGVARIGIYALLGLGVWVAVHESGVHATIAGVALGLLTPTGRVGGREVLAWLEHRLHPLSALAIVPLFALANAGVDFGGGVLGDALRSTVTWAVVAGLVVGKLAGISGATFLALRLGWGTLPAGVGRAHVVGLAALGGIGFTVSLFIAQLAFPDRALVDAAKVGIFLGSLLSGVLGATILLAVERKEPRS
jgi:Na+:H+ antiporter, NhaA family